ncbi:dITP/XTP pyrophosphatase [bacterium BMS3Abin09]|nr:dITP/XTP pyrophosphatase [bacterium BMS3Abin09]GBE41903.1 dITP/XTP pyrophosphatase [bacterium BMS3Bbin09]HDH34438.1 XTP/dITP diphosphatase [Nitrospirota bacterium]HDN94551.1 XTP/dITP diphosphatase [Nitrospirota bacterium]HDO66629.1 XTP/dITP diphosphatase [Nitrospirota bacterium]
MDIILASRNKKKIRELKKIIEEGIVSQEETTVNILTPDDFPQCEEVEEDGETFEFNAIKKAVYVSKCSGLTAIADDSGIEVDALDGAPGVYSARYAGETSDDMANNRKLLDEIKDVPDEKRTARFVCCIALATGDKIMTFTGHVEGKIGRENRGENGFGYDPLFFPEEHNRTFAEMTDDEKHSMSHRGRALAKLQECLKDKGLK